MSTLLTPNNTALALGLRAQQRPEASSTYYCESPRPENINQQCTLVQFWGVKNGALNSSKFDFTIKALSRSQKQKSTGRRATAEDQEQHSRAAEHKHREQISKSEGEAEKQKSI